MRQKAHDASGDHDTSLLLDIDLSILGSHRDRFERYEHDVRREFIWVPAEVFAEKRVGILKSFLRRPSIYQTETFRVLRESRARENLNWAIEQLGE